MGVGGGWGVLTWASGCNFPLFLVYPVDMPDILWLALSWLCRVGVSGCELGFTAIDVSSGSLGRIHGEGRGE